MILSMVQIGGVNVRAPKVSRDSEGQMAAAANIGSFLAFGALLQTRVCACALCGGLGYCPIRGSYQVQSPQFSFALCLGRFRRAVRITQREPGARRGDRSEEVCTTLEGVTGTMQVFRPDF